MITDYTITAEEADTITEPVGLEEAKAFANIDYADDDALIEDMIVAARQDIEQETNLKLVAHNVEVYATLNRGGSIRLPYGKPSYLSVTWLGDEGSESVDLADLEYSVSGSGVRVYNEGSFKVGYRTANAVPEGLREAIKMLVAYRYINRGDTAGAGIPKDIAHKVAKYREEWL